MPPRDSTKTEISCRVGRGKGGLPVRSVTDRTWVVVGVGGSPWAILPHPADPWGRESSWPLQAAWWTTSLQLFEHNVAEGTETHGPAPSSPSRRNYEITPGDANGIRGSQTDHITKFEK